MSNETTDFFIRAKELRPMVMELIEIKLLLDKMHPGNGNANGFNAEIYHAVYTSVFNLIQKMERKVNHAK